MLIERTQHLGVGYYERNNNRLDYANGYKPKQVKTRISELDLLVPQMMKLFLVTMSGLMQSMVIGLTMKNTPSGVANNIGSSVANLKSLEVIMNPECSSQVL